MSDNLHALRTYCTTGGACPNYEKKQKKNEDFVAYYGPADEALRPLVGHRRGNRWPLLLHVRKYTESILYSVVQEE
jgi:hypothetical protein